MTTKIPIKIQGFILHFGYVESNQVSPLILRSLCPEGFDSLESALKHLAHYLFEDFIENHHIGVSPSIYDFRNFLIEIPRMDANDFDQAHVNAEEWWPWDSIKEIGRVLNSFIEIKENAERVIMTFLDEDWAKILIECKLISLNPNWYQNFLQELTEWRADYEMSLKDILSTID